MSLQLGENTLQINVSRSADYTVSVSYFVQEPIQVLFVFR